MKNKKIKRVVDITILIIGFPIIFFFAFFFFLTLTTDWIGTDEGYMTLMKEKARLWGIK